MTVEGGSAYRQRLVSKQQNRAALADLKRRKNMDPMAWVKAEDEQEQSKLLGRTIGRMIRSGSIPATTTDNKPLDPIDSYFGMLDRAYGIEDDPTTKENEFKPGVGASLEGLMSPIISERKIDLSGARGLEGLRSNVPNERKGRFGGAEKASQRSGNDIIRSVGTANWSKRSEGTTPIGDIIKAVGSEFKRDPKGFGQDMAIGMLASFSNIASDLTDSDENLLAQALKYDPRLLGLINPMLASGNVRGKIMASEQSGLLKSDASAMDVADAASWFIPGVGFTKPAQVAAKVAMRAPKTVAAAGAGAGALAYTAMQPEEAQALSGSNMFKFISEGTSPLKRGVGETPNARARTYFRKTLGLSADEAKSRGLYEAITDKTYLEKAVKAYTQNPKYASSVINSKNSGDWQVLHPPGKALERGGRHIAKDVEWGSKKLNDLDEAMLRTGEQPQSWTDVINWAINNRKEYAGKTLREVAEELGALHLI